MDNEDGCLGVIWARANKAEDWVKVFERRACKSRPDLLGPGLLDCPGQPVEVRGWPVDAPVNPVTWVERYLTPIGVEAGFMRLKHKKVVEKLKGAHKDLLPVLRLVSDARLPPDGECEEYNRGVEAVMALDDAKEGKETTLSLDLHSWFAPVVPRK